MSALYSGIHTKLKNAKIPWEDKIKLAHFAWISHQCFLPNKEQVLLDWVCHALVGCHSKKLNLERDIQQKLWCFLDSILRSKRLECLVKEGKPVKLRFTIAQVMNDFISLSSVQQGPPADIATILSCCQTVLSTPALAFVYTTKYELMVDLLNKLCTLACRCLNNQSEQLLTSQVLKILHLSFNQYLQVQRQQSNPNRVFTYVMAQLFQPCLLLRNTLNVRVWSKDDDSQIRHQLIKDIRSNIETVLYSALFQPELLASYKEELLVEGDISEKKKISPKILLTPVSSILSKLEDCNFCNPNSSVSLLANSVSLIYKLFLDSYCKDGKEIFCFYMLVKLFQCLQSTIQFQQEDKATSFSGYSAGLPALEQLLNLALSHDIYNVAEDHIRHKDVQYQFYRKLAEMLICNPCTSTQSWFRCLRSLILLNHLIVEPDLDDLLSCAWIDADISDLRIRKAQESLISSLLQTYTKLRQFPKLFEEVVILICRPAADELRNAIITSSLSEKLADFLIQLPPNQILDVWAIILEKCSCDVLPDIKDDPDVSLKLVSLSSLLQCLLFNMKSLDNYTPTPVLARFHDLMKQMMDKLIMPSLTFVKEVSVNIVSLAWLPKLCDAVLLLLYTWVEVNTVTKLNCIKYVSQIKELPLLLESPIEGWDFSVFCGDKDCWNEVYKHCTESNPVSKFYLELLSIQKMKFILMHYASPTECMQLALQNAAFLIFHPVSELKVPKHYKPWSGNVNLVDTSSFHVAHWHLIASNLLIILPYIPLANIYSITDFLLESILPAQYTKDQTDKESSVSFEDISMALLRSDHFSELPVLQCAFITSIINKCAMALKEKNVLNVICDFLSAKDLNWHEDFLSSYSKGAKFSASDVADAFGHKISGCVTNLEVVVQYIMSMTKETKSVELCDSEINHLGNLIEFFSALKPDSLTPSDQCRCFFMLLSIARATSLRSLQLAGVCYRLMICLLNGKHSKSLFKLLFASDILKTVIISFQLNELQLTDAENKLYWPEFVSVVQSFFDTLLAVVLERKQSCLLNLEKFAEFVFQFVPDPKSKDWNSCIGQLLISVLSGLCRVLTTCIQEHIADKKKIETFCALLQQSVVTMHIVVQQCLKVSAPSQILPSFLVSCTTTLLEAELSCQDQIKAQNIIVYRSFCLQILRELPYAERQTLFLKAAFRYLLISITVEEIYSAQQMLVGSIFNSVKKLLSRPWINNEILQMVEKELKDLFNQMMERCSCEEFNTVLQSTLQGLEVGNLWKNSEKEIVSGVTITKLLLNSILKEDKGKVFWFTASQIMTALVTLANEACKDRSLLSEIVVPVMDTMALLLRRGEMFLINPHHVTLSFRTLLTVPLDHLRFEEYYSIFLAVHEVLFSILQCHSKAMLKSVAPFLSTFHRLLSSVMHEGQQKGDKGTVLAHESAIILKCAQLVERMYTHIAAKTEEFTVFSAFMVSQYVNELQKVTLQPAVKKHLTGGIFHILDLCIDRDIKFLNASLQMGVREVFKELYQEYTHQHKQRNRTEEKYTVL
ncbi:PREDICTED: unhealthy ribosome biogenesis protein 2 homolog [Nanorana parkeri]|uniref:unhealthy ribosome biogenesis protein 2 homolog n=1 Tax=Nanorana parkeri TaxID=125878 RepID=UPI00085413BC|nr:PREDICTED: unhealthy ribosome biogenesis protein 2 homolog [Nanorana parkeri]